MARVIYTPEFDASTIPLGGIAAVQAVIAPLVDVLERDPYVYALQTFSWGASFRYATTVAVGDMPALIVAYTIDADGDVLMEFVDRQFSY